MEKGKAAPPPAAAGGPPQQYDFYRKSTIGLMLTDSIDDLLQSGVITQTLGMKILKQFDASVAEALNNRVKNKATFKGHLHTYRYCDNVWTFILEDATFRTDTDTVQVDRVKIVACDGKAPQKEETK